MLTETEDRRQNLSYKSTLNGFLPWKEWRHGKIILAKLLIKG